MLEALFDHIQQARTAALSRDVGPWPRNNPVASDLGPCPRETTLAILHWKERPPFEERIAARLEQGRDAEAPAMARLLRLGIPVVEQQQMFELKDKIGRVVLRGKIDGKVAWEKRRIPFDYKTVHPGAFPRLNTVSDLMAHPFFSKWPKQLWAYEYMNDIDVGFLLLDNLMGEWKFIEVPMDWEAMERSLRQCEEAVEIVEQIRLGAPEETALPPYHPNPAVCHRCWCKGRVCFPPLALAGVTVADDPEFEADLAKREALEPQAKEFEALDKAIKERVRGKDGLIVGPYYVTGKELIVHYKAQPARESVQWRTKIERLAGEAKE